MNRSRLSEQITLGEAIAERVNNYAGEERRFLSTLPPRQTTAGRTIPPQLVDVDGARVTGRLALPQWEGSVGEDDAEWVKQDLREQKRAIISRVQRRSLQQLPSVSIVIPAFGRKLWTLECLDAIARQSVFSDEMRENCTVTCEIIVVQDGSVVQRNPRLTTHEDSFSGHEIEHEADKLPHGVTVRCIELTENKGRSTARNIGARAATGDVIVFLDSRMLLDVHALSEMLIRHALCTDKAVLLGFKQNISDADYFFHRHRIRGHQLRPAVLDGHTGDWKIQRNMQKERLTSHDSLIWRDKALHSPVNFMEETNWLQGMKGDERIGVRTIAHFVSTGLVSCTRTLFLASGGFDQVMQDAWGLEDSLLGIRFVKEGGTIIPCPTASAFLVDDTAVETDDRGVALVNNADYLQEQLALPENARPLSVIDASETDLPIKSARTFPGGASTLSNNHVEFPEDGIDFDYTPESSALFEQCFLQLMQICVADETQVFTTTTQHVPFIGRTLGQQKHRHDDKLKGAHSEFHFYQVRRRYDLWEDLGKKQQIHIVLDRQTLTKYFAPPGRSFDPLSEEYFGTMDRYIQATRLLMLIRDFPDIFRVARTQITASVLQAGDYELHYFNRVPLRRTLLEPSDHKGRLQHIKTHGRDEVKARWDRAKSWENADDTAEYVLTRAQDALRHDVLMTAHRPVSPFFNRLGLGLWRCVANGNAPAAKHSYQDSALGSDGMQCWIVCDGVTPTLPTGDPDPTRSNEVKLFADRLALYLLGLVAESRESPASLTNALTLANAWVRTYNQTHGFEYTTPGKATPFAATVIIAISAPHGLQWASLGDCVIAVPMESGWQQLNRHQTEDVSDAVASVGDVTRAERDTVVAQLRNHHESEIQGRTFRGFGVLNGETQATDLIETGVCDAPIVVLGSDGIHTPLLDTKKDALPCSVNTNSLAVKKWLMSPEVSAKSDDDKTILVLVRQP